MRRFPSILAALLTSASLASAQPAIKNADGTWSPANGTGRFNNPMSAVIEGQINRARDQQLIFSRMLMQETFNEQWRTIGRQVIADGKATTALAPLDAAMASRIVERTGDRLADADRKKLVDELTADLASAAQVIFEAGGRPDDLASVLAVTMEWSHARMTGVPFSPRRRDALTETWRNMLLSDLIVQGQGAIAREGTVAKYAAGLASLRTLERANDPQAAAVARGLLQALWHLPVASIEATDTGFIDRGERIVRDGTGTTTFKPGRPLAEQAEAVAAQTDFTLTAGIDKDLIAQARAKWAADWAARQEACAARARELGLPEKDLAATATAATTFAWPGVVDAKLSDVKSIDATAARQLYELFAKDIKTDPSFQRLDDAARYEIAVAWADRAGVAAWKLAAALEADRLRAVPESDDAMENLLRGSKIGTLDAEVSWGRTLARQLLADLFAPRPLEGVKRRDDGTFEFPETPKVE